MSWQRAYDLLRGVPGEPARDARTDEWDGSELRRDHEGKLAQWQTVMCAGDVWPSHVSFVVDAQLITRLYRAIEERKGGLTHTVDYDFEAFGGGHGVRVAGVTQSWEVVGEGKRLVVAVDWAPDAHRESLGKRLSVALHVGSTPTLVGVSLVAARGAMI